MASIGLGVFGELRLRYPFALFCGMVIGFQLFDRLNKFLRVVLNSPIPVSPLFRGRLQLAGFGLQGFNLLFQLHESLFSTKSNNSGGDAFPKKGVASDDRIKLPCQIFFLICNNKGKLA
jgi:hypothetical protein